MTTKDTIDILCVCGYGVGSSAMSANLIQKSLASKNVNAKVLHAAAGDAQGFANSVDVIVVSKKFTDIVNKESFPKQDILEVVNIMDGNGIADRVIEVTKDKFPNAFK